MKKRRRKGIKKVYGDQILTQSPRERKEEGSTR
jgi:hypothetical protein